MAFYGTHIAAMAAAEQERKQDNAEEEIMTKYTHDDLQNDWEFKIVRSASGAFKNPEELEALLEEEGLSGWGMVEKFDNNRIRFKRPARAKKRDAMLPDYVDPYRTQYGISAGRRELLIVAVSIGVALLVVIGAIVFVVSMKPG